jgi:hypothetical protein
MSKASLRYLVFPLILFSLCCSACAHQLKPAAGGSYSDPKGHFELTLPWLKDHQGAEGWQLLSWKDVDFVLWEQKTGATIVVNVTPLKQGEDLITLTNRLLIAFERKQIISRDTEQIDGREALKTVFEAWVERTEIMAEVSVVRGQGVYYDILFWAPRDAFPRQVETFHQLLASIHFLQP